MSKTTRFSDGQYKNWLKCSQSLVIMKEALHDYIDNEAKKIHADIAVKVSSKHLLSPGSQCGSCSSRNIRIKGTKHLTWYINCANGICDKWLHEILAIHNERHNPTINWKNADISKWPTDCYQVAKIFMPKGQDKTTKMPDELDATAILSLMKYCNWFRTDLPNTLILSDLIDVRNKIMHSGVLKVSDSDKDSWIDLMIQLLNDLNIYGGAQAELQLLKTENIDVNFRETEIRVLQNMVSGLVSEHSIIKENIGSLRNSQILLSEEMEQFNDISTETTRKLNTVEADIKGMNTTLYELNIVSSKMVSFFEKNPEIFADIKITEIIRNMGLEVQEQQRKLLRAETELKKRVSLLEAQIEQCQEETKKQIEKHQEETKKQFEKHQEETTKQIEGVKIRLASIEGQQQNGTFVEKRETNKQIEREEQRLFAMKEQQLNDTSFANRWYYDDTSFKESGKQLMEKGNVGSYLVNESQSNPEDMVLSVGSEDIASHDIICYNNLPPREECQDYSRKEGGRPTTKAKKQHENIFTVDHTTAHLRDRDLNGVKSDYNNAKVFTQLSWQEGHQNYSRKDGGSPETKAKIHDEDGNPDDVGTDYYNTSLCREGRQNYSRKDGGSPETKAKIQDEDFIADGIPNDVGTDYYNANFFTLKEGLPDYVKKEGGRLDTKVENQYENSLSFDPSTVHLSDGDDNTVGSSYYNALFLTHQHQQEGRQKHIKEEGGRPETKAKNQHDIMLPFDHTRVRLRDGNPEVVASDYINANFITHEDDNIEQKKCYIATQVPLLTTVCDFWRMIWQENCMVIVMTTKEVDYGEIKGVRYWPDPEYPNDPEEKRMPVYNATLVVKYITQKKEKDYVVRELQLTRESEDGKVQGPRMIYHFQNWRDYDILIDHGYILDFLNIVNTQQNKIPNAGPMVVHGSAGIGKTGTLIVIDIILNQIKTYGTESEVDIQKTVMMVRTQRSGMVKTEAHYKFVSLVVKHFIETEQQRKQAEKQGQSDGTEYVNFKHAAIIDVRNSLPSSANVLPLPPKCHIYP